jgi:hypothetical protein
MSEPVAIDPVNLEFVFQIHLFLKERIPFKPTTPLGGRVYVAAAAGEVTGPRLQGKIIPYSGAEWPRGRQDHVYEVNAHYMLEASDGTPIYIHNRGFNYSRDDDGTPTPYRPQDGFAANPNRYLRLTPVFDVPVGPHDWLTRTVIVGTGVRYANPDRAVFTYYAVL